jgi:hypothetical protein
MAKKSKKQKSKLNTARLIKGGTTAVFVVFAGVLVYISLFVLRVLTEISEDDTTASDVQIRGLLITQLEAIEEREAERMDRPVPDYSRRRDPYTIVVGATPAPVPSETVPPPEPPPVGQSEEPTAASPTP